MSKDDADEAAATASESLEREFSGEWKITPNPGGMPMWTALHREDRSERYVVAPTAGKLLAKLRALRQRGG